MSHQEDRDGGMLDGSLSSYYRQLADAPVPTRLEDRTIRSLQARESRGGAMRHFSLRRSWVASAAVAAIVVAAVALAGIPWARVSNPALVGGPSSSATATRAGQPTASSLPSGTTQPTASSLPSGATRITAVNLGTRLLTVTIGDTVAGQLSCGQTGTYGVTSYPSRIMVSTDQGSSGSATLTHPSTQQWWTYRADIWTLGDSAPPPANRSYAVCPTTMHGLDTAHVVTSDFEYPTVQGTAADTQINRNISDAVTAWSSELALDLVELRDERPTPTGTGSVTGTYQADTSMPGLLPLAFYLQPNLDPAPGDPIATWSGFMTVDLSDGHLVGADELFTNSSAGLAVLSAQSRSLMQMPADGGPYAAETAPLAANFKAWFPEKCEGLQIAFPDATRASWRGASMYQTLVTIPWSALDGLLKPDSPVRAEAKCVSASLQP